MGSSQSLGHLLGWGQRSCWCEVLRAARMAQTNCLGGLKPVASMGTNQFLGWAIGTSKIKIALFRAVLER